MAIRQLLPQLCDLRALGVMHFFRSNSHKGHEGHEVLNNDRNTPVRYSLFAWFQKRSSRAVRSGRLLGSSYLIFVTFVALV